VEIMRYSLEYKACFFSENFASNYPDFYGWKAQQILLSNPKASYATVPLHIQGNRFEFLTYGVTRNTKLLGNGKMRVSANLNETHIHFIQYYIGLCVERVLSSVD
jgi:hypothetical protein